MPGPLWTGTPPWTLVRNSVEAMQNPGLKHVLQTGFSGSRCWDWVWEGKVSVQDQYLWREERGRRRERTEGGLRVRCRRIRALATPVWSPGQAPQSCPAPALGEGLRGRGWQGESRRAVGTADPGSRTESAAPPRCGEQAPPAGRCGWSLRVYSAGPGSEPTRCRRLTRKAGGRAALDMRGGGQRRGRLVGQSRDVQTAFHPFAPAHPGASHWGAFASLSPVPLAPSCTTPRLCEPHNKPTELDHAGVSQLTLAGGPHPVRKVLARGSLRVVPGVLCTSPSPSRLRPAPPLRTHHHSF